MHEPEWAELTCACMLEDGNGNVLVQERIDPKWSGVAFPGGHVEAGESFAAAIIREMEEETGLRLRNPRLCGVKHWQTETGRYIVFFYRARDYSGALRDCEEGRNFWVSKDGLRNAKLASGFADNLEVFFRDELDELHYEKQDGEWMTRYYGETDHRPLK